MTETNANSFVFLPPGVSLALNLNLVLVTEGSVALFIPCVKSCLLWHFPPLYILFKCFNYVIKDVIFRSCLFICVLFHPFLSLSVAPICLVQLVITVFSVPGAHC